MFVACHVSPKCMHSVSKNDAMVDSIDTWSIEEPIIAHKADIGSIQGVLGDKSCGEYF